MFSRQQALAWRRGVVLAMAMAGLGVSFWPSSALADVMLQAQETSTSFGHLNQFATNNGNSPSAPNDPGTYLVTPPTSPSQACGPVATTNSFIYLQNRYGLTGLVNNAAPYNTANTLASAGYMNTGNTGSTAQQLYMGKEKYLENNFKPQNGYVAIQTVGQTGYAPFAQAANGPWVGGIQYAVPTPDFIQQQLAAGEDVEMFFAWANSDGTVTPNAGAHWVTLTGINYDKTTNSGTISFIDPTATADSTYHDASNGANSGAGVTSDSLEVLSSGAYKGAMFFGYTGGATGTNNQGDNPDSAGYGIVGNVIAESPVPAPEPSALALLALGGLVLVARRRVAGVKSYTRPWTRLVRSSGASANYTVAET